MVELQVAFIILARLAIDIVALLCEGERTLMVNIYYHVDATLAPRTFRFAGHV